MHILVVFHLLLLAEKEVLITLTSNLKIYHMAHVFKVFDLVHMLFLLIIVRRLNHCLNSLLLIIFNWLSFARLLKHSLDIFLYVSLFKGFNSIAIVIKVMWCPNCFHSQLV